MQVVNVPLNSSSMGTCSTPAEVRSCRHSHKGLGRPKRARCNLIQTPSLYVVVVVQHRMQRV